MKRNILGEKPVTRAEVEEMFTQFRSEMFTRFDQIIGKLEQVQEEQAFITHDNRVLKETDVDHEKRLTKLEKSSKATN